MPLTLVSRRRALLLAVLCPLLIVSWWTAPPSARAASIEVNFAGDGINDDGLCGLREAIIAANTNTATAGCDTGDEGTDVIAINPGTYELTVPGTGEDEADQGDLDVLESVQITGLGGDRAEVVIDAGGQPGVAFFPCGSAPEEGLGIDRVLHILNPDVSTEGVQQFLVEINGVTIRGGTVATDSGSALGGGVLNEAADLVVDNSIVEDNVVYSDNELSGGAAGGGIMVTEEAGPLEVVDSVMRRNGAVAAGLAAGGGIANVEPTLTPPPGGAGFVEDLGREASGSRAPGALGEEQPDALLQESRFGNNYSCAQFIAGGGGVALGGVSVTEDSRFLNNAAVGSIGLGGGALFGPVASPGGEGSAEVARSLFQQNAAISPSTPTPDRFAGGGGVATVGGATVGESEFTENTAGGEAGLGSDLVIRGGGLSHIGGELQLSQSLFDSNVATSDIFEDPETPVAGREGRAGIRPRGEDPGTVTLDGGGLATEDVAQVTNSTFSANEANRGGGVFHGSSGEAAEDFEDLVLENVTITENSATDGAGLFVDATLTSPGFAFPGASLIVNQQAGDDCGASGASAAITSRGWNMDSDETCNLEDISDQSPVDLILLPLEDNGGETRTHALPVDSPAVDAIGGPTGPGGDTCPPPIVDQRGVDRPQNGDGEGKFEECDIGAFELEEDAEEFCPGFDGDPRNQVIGSPGPDDLEGTPAADVICGGSGDDFLDGLGDNDVIIGGEGEDVMAGGPGNDRLRGFGAQDTARGGPGDDRISGNRGPDFLLGNGGDDTVRGGRQRDDISGGRGDDILRGWVRGDSIAGGSGADLIQGEVGNDLLSGNGGPDEIYGGKNHDRLFGQVGDDRLDGGGGGDDLDGGPASDQCKGGPGPDTTVNCES